MAATTSAKTTLIPKTVNNLRSITLPLYPRKLHLGKQRQPSAHRNRGSVRDALTAFAAILSATLPAHCGSRLGARESKDGPHPPDRGPDCQIRHGEQAAGDRRQQSGRQNAAVAEQSPETGHQLH